MGIWDSLKSGIDSFTAGVQGEVAKLRDKNAVLASLAIVALVAGADGEVEDKERKAAVSYVAKGDLFKAFDRSMLSSTLNGYYEKATDDILKEDLIDVIRKVKGTDGATAAIKVGIGIAKADGEFEPEERVILLEVVKALDLNPKDFPALAA